MRVICAAEGLAGGLADDLLPVCSLLTHLARVLALP